MAAFSRGATYEPVRRIWQAEMPIGFPYGVSSDRLHQVLLDPNGDVIIVATKFAKLSATPLVETSRLFVAKFSGVNGGMLWSNFEPRELRQGSLPPKAKLDAAGNIYVAGFQASSTDYSDSHLFAAKYDNATGARLWYTIAQADPAVHGLYFGGLDVSSTGEVVVRGPIEDRLGSYTSYGDAVKLDASGKVLWQASPVPNGGIWFGPAGQVYDSKLQQRSAVDGSVVTPSTALEPMALRVFGHDILTGGFQSLRRLNGATLGEVWAAPPPPEGTTDYVNEIQMRADGSAAVSGTRWSTNFYAQKPWVAGYAADGVKVWEHEIEGPSTGGSALLSADQVASRVHTVAAAGALEEGGATATQLYRYDAATGEQLTHVAQVGFQIGGYNEPPLAAASEAKIVLADRGTSQRHPLLTCYETLPGFSDETSIVLDGRSATVMNTVSGSALPRTMSIRWGAELWFAQSTAPMAVSGTGSISAKLGTLRAGTYLYHVVYTTPGQPDLYGPDQTFIVPATNLPPVAVEDTFTATMSREILLDFVANDSDGDGDPLTVTEFAGEGDFFPGRIFGPPDAHGQYRFLPMHGYSGSFTVNYTISDGQGGTAKGRATIKVVRPKEVLVRPLVWTGSKVPDYDDTYFQHFSAVGDAPFFATVKSPTAKYGTMLVSREGTVIASFRNQVIGLGTPSGLTFTGRILEDGNEEREAGLFRFDGTDPIALAKIGQPAPGAEPAVFRRFIAYDGTGPTTFFLATLGGEGVTPRNDLALYAASPNAPARLIARKGMPYFNKNTQTSKDARLIVNLATLVSYPKTPAEGRWVHSGQSFGMGDNILVRLTLDDGTQGACYIPGDANGPEDWFTCMTTFAPDSGGITSIGAVTSGPDSFGAVVMRKPFGSTVPKPYIFEGSGVGWYVADDLIARDFIFGGPGKFAIIYQAPWVLGYQVLETHDVNYPRTSTLQRPLKLRTYHDDTPVPGVGSDARFADFTSVTYLDGPEFGLAFTGEMQVGRGGVTNANRRGIWAQDSKGKLRLVLRQGQTVAVGGKARTIARFVALQTAAHVTGTSRGTDPNGVIYAHAYFTDGTEAALELTLP